MITSTRDDATYLRPLRCFNADRRLDCGARPVAMMSEPEPTVSSRIDFCGLLTCGALACDGADDDADAFECAAAASTPPLAAVTLPVRTRP